MFTTVLPFATTADAIRRGFSTNAGDTSGNWLAAAFMIGCGLLVVSAIAYRGWKLLRHRNTPAATLLRQARKAALLSASDMRRLTRIARSSDIEHPLTLLLSPTLLRKARSHLAGKDADAVDRILLRMAT